MADLDGCVDLVLDGGPTVIGVESTIVDCTKEPPVLLRPGGVTREQLLAYLPALAMREARGHADTAQAAPGQLIRHYAPTATVTLYEGTTDTVCARLATEARALAGAGRRVGILAPEEDVMALAPLLAAQAASGRVLLRGYGRRDAPELAAQSLFAALRALDAEGPDIIMAAGIGVAAIAAAVHDRLMRAAEGRVVRL
jgi:L-threonylcarbamoyladenylate synthase